ncbi:hypothetical protein Pelo_1307 [Pelomyxa schiedti]|nr:hypothetical protein Pelo_1307 [Pelomyxa schiedti]
MADGCGAAEHDGTGPPGLWVRAVYPPPHPAATTTTTTATTTPPAPKTRAPTIATESRGCWCCGYWVDECIAECIVGNVGDDDVATLCTLDRDSRNSRKKPEFIG